VDDVVADDMCVTGVTIELSKTPGRVNSVPTPGERKDEVVVGVVGCDRATAGRGRRTQRHSPQRRTPP
jgi:hypothetical protein